MLPVVAHRRENEPGRPGTFGFDRGPDRLIDSQWSRREPNLRIFQQNIYYFAAMGLNC